MNFSVGEKIKSVKTQYKPDLDELLSQCELNYLLLIRLCPNLNHSVTKSRSLTDNEVTDDIARFANASNSINLTLDLVETAKYTTTMKLFIKSPKIKINQSIELLVRLYHDAKMLEVMEGSGPSTLKAIYHKANKAQKMVDEKRQVNRFVGECLRAVTLC
jgi:uncharacterized protein YqiB (DUF1249 family)